MIKHLFKLIWHKRRKHFLLMSEIFIAFLVVFAVASLLVYYYRNFRTPIGLDYENVWVIHLYNPNQLQGDTLQQHIDQVRHTLKGFQEIEAYSFCGSNVPFTMSTSNADFFYKNNRVTANNYMVEPAYFEVLGIKTTAGRVLEAADAHAAHPILVANESLRKALFASEQPTGISINMGDTEYKVAGVVNDFKDKGNFKPTEPGMFRLIGENEWQYINTILIKVRGNADISFEENLWKKLSALSPDLTIEVERMADKRLAINKLTWVPMLILAIVCGFLIFNVALGLFGVLWYNINLRKEEIGIRRALGATGRQVTRQFIGEALVIATFAMGLGTVLALQFPLLKVFDVSASVYVGGLILAVCFLYIVVGVCAFYPGVQAAAIEPATALHND